MTDELRIKDVAELERAYNYCREVTRRHAKSFYFAAKFLPARKQKPIYALYALCRHVDDEVDEAEISSAAEAVRAVEKWKQKLNAVYKNSEKIQLQTGDNKLQKELSGAEQMPGDEQNLILLAWADLLKTYKIPQNLPLELMKGVLMDMHVKRYETFAELYVYCYRVASTVGLMSSEIFGYEKPETLRYAESLGIAMQLTNILRDVKEDAEIDRIYLPREDLRRFGVSEQQIFEKRFDDNFIELMKFEIARARDYYRIAGQGIYLLEKDTRLPVLLAAGIYGKILDEIEKQDYNIFTRRARTSARQKFFAIPRIWLEERRL